MTEVIDADITKLQVILAESDLPFEKKAHVLITAMTALTPQAHVQAQAQAPGAALGDGEFLKILMQLLVQFLPLLLKLLAG